MFDHSILTTALFVLVTASTATATAAHGPEPQEADRRSYKIVNASTLEVILSQCATDTWPNECERMRFFYAPDLGSLDRKVPLSRELRAKDLELLASAAQAELDQAPETDVDLPENLRQHTDYFRISRALCRPLSLESQPCSGPAILGMTLMPLYTPLMAPTVVLDLLISPIRAIRGARKNGKLERRYREQRNREHDQARALSEQADKLLRAGDVKVDPRTFRWFYEKLGKI
jgi:hypothetical protein